jgi:hypothetical protein
VSLEKGLRNFDVFYFYAYKDWSNQPKEMSQVNLFVAEMEISDAATSITKGNTKILSANVTQGMNFTDCYNITHLCFIMYSSKMASFNDSQVTNNLRCYSISVVKDCEPGLYKF